MTDKHQNNDGLFGPQPDRDSAGPDLGSLQAAELKMREALGLYGRSDRPQPDTAPGRAVERPAGDRPAGNGHATTHSNGHGNGHRHRFVQDGEVPVVMAKHAGPGGAAIAARATTASPGSNRLAALSADLGMERAGRERAERGLAHAQAVLRDLQTKLAHAELARSEAVEQARVLQERIAALRVAQREQHERAQVELLTERRARQAAEAALQAARAPADAPRKRGRPPKSATLAPRVAVAKKPAAPRPAREPKPVRWWIRSEPGSKR